MNSCVLDRPQTTAIQNQKERDCFRQTSNYYLLKLLLNNKFHFVALDRPQTPNFIGQKKLSKRSFSS